MLVQHYSLHSPAYMDEYEKLEEELQKLYSEYMSKFRNQAYLEQLMEEHNRHEQDKTEVCALVWTWLSVIESTVLGCILCV